MSYRKLEELEEDKDEAVQAVRYSKEMLKLALARVADARSHLAAAEKRRDKYIEQLSSFKKLVKDMNHASPQMMKGKSAADRYQFAKDCLRILGVGYYNDATTRGRSIKLDYVSDKVAAVVEKVLVATSDAIHEGGSLDGQNRPTEFTRYHFYTGCTDPGHFQQKNKRQQERRAKEKKVKNKEARKR